MKNLFDLNGKVALVTGGRRGIGKELALTLRQAGADVAVTARSEDRGNLPSDIYYFQTDLACRNARKSVIQKW